MAADVGAARTGSVETALGHAAALVAMHPEAALAQVREVLAAVPGHPQARLIEARALRAAGDPDGARAILVPLAREQHRAAAVAYELGVVADACGDEALAIRSFRHAAQLKPDAAPIWSALAAALRRAGNDAEADRADLAAIRAATRDPVLIEAALALGEGRPEVAEPLLRDRLKRDPRDVAATRMLGELAWRLGRVDDAVTLLRRALALAPAFQAARELLARILGRDGRVAEAMVETTALIAADPADPGHALLHASLLVRTGDQEGAREIYEALLAKHPQQPRTWLNLGHVLKTIGRQAGSIDAYRRAIAIAPTLGEAWWSLANLKTVRFDAADIAAMRAALAGVTGEGAANEAGSGAGNEAGNEDRFHLHFALGKALEDAGEDHAAFDHYAAGNRLRRATLDYDADETHAATAATAALVTRGFLAERAGEGCAARDPIFIVGLPRSGSTLIEQILSSHSMIEGTMELPDMMMIAERLASRKVGGRRVPLTETLRTLTADDRRRLGEEYVERTRPHRTTGRPLFIDKMPNNWQHVGLIRMILPNAKIIDARRHPIGCCFSAWKQHFARGQGFSYDLRDLGRYYRDYVAHMAAFDAAAPGAVHRVIYERMVADTQAEVTRLLAYAGVPFEDACLAFWRNDRMVRTASSEQVRRPIFTDAVDHWQRFAPWLGPLVEALGPVVDAYPEAPPAR